MTKDEIFLKIHDIYESWDGGQISLDITSEDHIKEIIQQAIDFIPCCEQLLCVDKDDDNGITVGYKYNCINQDNTHYKIIDNYGYESWFLRGYFKKTI